MGVYVLYDANRTPVYVGQAGSGNADLFGRLKSHRRDHLQNRWQYVSWFGFRSINKNGTLAARQDARTVFHSTGVALLDEIEAILIALLEPTLNKQGPKWGATEEFIQAIDEQVQEWTLEDIYYEIQKLKKTNKKK